METLKAIDSFILACKADGLKPRTTETYQLRLQRFKDRFAEQDIVQNGLLIGGQPWKRCQ